jgi:hypothetical protein
MPRAPPPTQLKIRELNRSQAGPSHEKTQNLSGEMMFKNKLIAAGILSISAFALSVPAMASSWSYSKANYNGRYSCRIEASSSSETEGISATYIVQPNGWGVYTAGELYLNVDGPTSPVCVFDLVTWGGWASYYWVDSTFGVVNETLNWYPASNNPSACANFVPFSDSVQGSLVVTANSSQAASQTQITDNNLYQNAPGSAGSGNCLLGGNVNPMPNNN